MTFLAVLLGRGVLYLKDKPPWRRAFKAFCDKAIVKPAYHAIFLRAIPAVNDKKYGKGAS